MEFKKQKQRIQEIEQIIKSQPIQPSEEEIIQEQKEKMTRIEVIKLPYSYSALKTFIDAETMNVHYNQHYKGYVNKLNKELEKIKDESLTLENIIKGISRYSRNVHNNAGGAYNHELFWQMLSPKKQNPNGPVLDKIKKKFGSYAEFKKEFKRKSQSQFGSGWVWLVLTKRGDIKIMTTPIQDNPMMNTVKEGGIPLLGLDLWEHAYYLKYKNKRDEYVNNFFEVINWSFVNKQFDQYQKGKINETRIVKELINEGVSRGCSPKQVNMYRMLFNQNPRIKKKFMYTIMDILKEVFKDNLYEKNEYADGKMSGIYDFEGRGRSVINKLNTNYTAFCILVNDINEVLNHYGNDPINFIGKDENQQMKELGKLLSKLTEFRYRIFNLESATFQTIMASLEKSNKFGDEREVDAVESLKKIFNVDNVTKTGELGGVDDMLAGIDAIVELPEGKKTIQIKPFNGFENNEGVITVFGSGNVKPYSTDYLVFHNNKKGTLVFKNDNTVIERGRYTFPFDSWVNPQ